MALPKWLQTDVPSDAMPPLHLFTGPARVKQLYDDGLSSEWENSWMTLRNASFTCRHWSKYYVNLRIQAGKWNNSTTSTTPIVRIISTILTRSNSSTRIESASDCVNNGKLTNKWCTGRANRKMYGQYESVCNEFWWLTYKTCCCTLKQPAIKRKGNGTCQRLQWTIRKQSRRHGKDSSRIATRRSWKKWKMLPAFTDLSRKQCMLAMSDMKRRQ